MPQVTGRLAPALDAYLRKHNSPLAGLGSQFVQFGQQYGVDPRLLVSIAGAETSLGTYGPSQKIHNPFGMGPGISYGNYGQAIAAAAKNLGQNYLGKGLKTIPQIQGKWAPSGADNDPTGLNNNWVKNVSQYYSELGGDPGVSAEVGHYVQTAADLERKYAGVGDAGAGAPPLTPPAPTPPVLTAAQQQHIEQVAQASTPQLGAGLGQLRGSSLTPLARTPTDVGSNALATAQTQQIVRDRMTKDALGAGMQLHIDTPDPIAPEAAGIVGSAAQYVKEHPVVQNVITKGKSFLGDPYKWGGESPQTGFDCSGFAQWLYGQQGIKLPRVTYDQIKAGKGVNRKNLMPGDLVFFGSKADPHHEGIYIGNGQFMHAPHTGDVIKISSLNDGYYKQHFVTGRRVT